MNLSKRSNNMQFSPIRKLVPFAEEAKKHGKKVYPLNIGQPDIETPREFFKGIQTYDKKVLKYSDSLGDKKLIESFINYYKEWDIELEKSEILITCGGSEALLFALMAICDIGDEVLIPEPFYTNYNTFADICGVKISSIVTKPEEGFHLPSKEAIEDAITPKTRAILMSNPSNPTGVVYTAEEIKMLGDIAIENDIFIIADEVYREFVYDNYEYTSTMTHKDAWNNIILIDSVSKRYSACGARIGVLASKNKDVITQCTKLCQARLSVSSVDQIGAANLINTPKSYFQKVNEKYAKRRDILYSALKAIPGVVCKKPAGAFYIVAKLPIKNCEHFAKWLLTDYSYKNETVFLTPAKDFYITEGLGKDQVRISYCINGEDLKTACHILNKALNDYKKLYE